jgi:hypothetical protein
MSEAIPVSRYPVPELAEMPEVSEADFTALKSHGFSEDDAWHIAAISAFFGLSNRLANVADMRPNEEFYAMGREPATWSGRLMKSARWWSRCRARPNGWDVSRASCRAAVPDGERPDPPDRRRPSGREPIAWTRTWIVVWASPTASKRFRVHPEAHLWAHLRAAGPQRAAVSQ